RRAIPVSAADRAGPGRPCSSAGSVRSGRSEGTEDTQAVGDGAAGDVGVPGERFELVRHPGMQVELHVDPGRAEPPGVVEVFVAEDVELADLEVRRRQAREVGQLDIFRDEDLDYAR